MCCFVYFNPCAKGCDPNRHLPLGADLDISFETPVRAVDDLINGVGRGRAIRIGLIVAIELLGNVLQPAFKFDGFTLLLTGIESGKTADNPSLALRNDQLGGRDDEHGRTDHRYAQIAQDGRKRHAGCSFGRWV